MVSYPDHGLFRTHSLRYVNLPDSYGRTALHYAAWVGDLAISDSLLTAGAHLTAQATSDCCDQELPCNSGSTALHLATLRGHVALVLLLLTSYVDAVVEAAESRQGSVSASSTTQPGHTPVQELEASHQPLHGGSSLQQQQQQQEQELDEEQQEQQQQHCSSTERCRETHRQQQQQSQQHGLGARGSGDGAELLQQHSQASMRSEQGQQPVQQQQQQLQEQEQSESGSEEQQDQAASVGMIDPRGVLDAYGMSPYSLAARQKDKMLMKVGAGRAFIDVNHWTTFCLCLSISTRHPANVPIV